MDRPGQMGLPVDEGGAVEGGEEPLVGVHHERVRQFHAFEPVARRRGEEGGAPVGPVHVEPQGPLPGHPPHPGQVVDDAGVGGATGGHHGDDVGGPGMTVQGGGQSGSGEVVVVTPDEQRLHPQHPERFAHRGVGFLADGHHRPGRSPFPEAVARGVPGHHQRRQVARRSAGDEASSRPFREAGQLAEDPERLVLGGDGTGGLHPRCPLERGAGHHHVEEQGRLGRRGRDERQEPRAVAGDHRRGQLVVEDLHDVVGVGPRGVDQAVEAGVERRRLGPTEVQGDRIECQAPPAVVEDEGGQLLVVDEHGIAHGVLSGARSGPVRSTRPGWSGWTRAGAPIPRTLRSRSTARPPTWPTVPRAPARPGHSGGRTR